MKVKERVREIGKILEDLQSVNLGAQEIEIDDTVELGEAFSEIVKGRTPTYCWVASLGYLRGLISLIEFEGDEYILTKIDSDGELEILGEWKDRQEALVRLAFELGKIYERKVK